MDWTSKVYDRNVLEGQSFQEKNAAKARAFDAAARDNEINQSAQMLNDQYKGLAAQEAAGLNQTKSDLAQMMLGGSQEDAIRATQYADSMKLFNPIEMKGLAAARVEQDMMYGGGR